MSKKKLYIVTVEYEYPVLAEDDCDAVKYVNEALDGAYLHNCARAREAIYFPGPSSTTPVVNRPDDYSDDDLVYGADTDITLGAAIQAEVDELTGAKKAAEFEDKQGKLFKD